MTMATFPKIDFQNPDLASLHYACREFGFFVLENHCIDAQLIEAALVATQQFFKQPLAEKSKIRRSATNCWGYNDAELTKNKRDWKEILDIGPAETEGPLQGATPQWPALPQFKETMTTLSDAMHFTALGLVEAIAQCLDTHIDSEAAFGAHTSFLRLNYYPECHTPATDTQALVPTKGELGISHHSDAGALTVLVQDGLRGLQVYKDGHWIDVPHERGSIIINIGDVVQVWSNDLYPAPLHRVLASTRTQRISIPYFLNPAYSYNYAPLSGAPRYREINWGEFRFQRSAGDYADLGSEIQIADFAIKDS